ncbi:AMIN domain-containing protein [Sulfurimonas sp. HSL3-7]|uniref:AMIN domain-containing protein n=1 Tax=Sulfonitrofixus jiaomeiensis TaxID=3131938 RepID=UPI0031F8F201
MRLLFLSLLLLPILLGARENPFVPAEVTPAEAATQHDTVPAPEKEKRAVPTIHPQRISNKKTVVNYAKARFVFRENSAYIETKDDIIKHFSIATPPSIVIDFRSPSDFPSKRKELDIRPFVKLEMGAHDDHYRVVLRLDRVHNYNIEKRKYGQLLRITD